MFTVVNYDLYSSKINDDDDYQRQVFPISG